METDAQKFLTAHKCIPNVHTQSVLAAMADDGQINFDSDWYNQCRYYVFRDGSVITSEGAAISIGRSAQETMDDAVAEVLGGVIDGVRGLGCATIIMTNETRYIVTQHLDEVWLRRVNEDGGDIVDISIWEGANNGFVSRVEWAVDQSGNKIMRQCA